MTYLTKKCMDVSSEKAQKSLIEHFMSVIITPTHPDQQLMENVLQNIKYAYKVWLRIKGNSADRIHLFRFQVLAHTQESRRQGSRLRRQAGVHFRVATCCILTIVCVSD